MKSNYALVRQGTKGLAHADLVVKTRNIVQMMTDNPAFPDPTPSLQVVSQNCDILDEATRSADFTRGRIERARRDEAYDKLRVLVMNLANYVQAASRGDALVIMSAGFDVKLKRQPSAMLEPPQYVKAGRTAAKGCLFVRWGAVKNKKLYKVEINDADPTDPGAWRLLTTTSKTFMTVEGLESFKAYAFRIIAIGALGDSPASDFGMAWTA
jgi:hypothetical protein